MDSTTPYSRAGMVSERSFSNNSFSLSQPNDDRSSRFRGVVLLHSGNWGARISIRYQLVWLGTFPSAEEAARAYDTAALKLHKGDSFLNFPWSDHSPQELLFQSCYSSVEIFKMIKDKSYSLNLATFIADQSSMMNRPNDQLHEQRISYQLLFSKVLTPRDVAKHPRLLIPREYALVYFPPVTGDSESIQLMFYDKDSIPWTFRYSCWESNQSFVFTTGYKQFVNAKRLQRGETISFYRFKIEEEPEERTFFMVDVDRGDNWENDTIDLNMGEEINVGRKNDNEMEVDDKGKEEADKGFMLFGVKLG